LKSHRSELVDPKIDEHHGRMVKTTGDGVLVEFPSVVDAVRCAVEVQRGMVERNSAILPEERIEFRVGINLGDVIAEGEDISAMGSTSQHVWRRLPSRAGSTSAGSSAIKCATSSITPSRT
jgi:adenylate cyclase